MGLNDDQLSSAEHDDVRARLLAGAKRIKPAGAHRRAIVTTTVAVAVVAVLSVGAIGAANFLRMEPAPVATSSPVPSPSATPTSTPIATPTPSATTVNRVVYEPSTRFTFDCEDVAPDVSGFFGGAVPTVGSTIPRAEGNALVPGPMQYAFEQAGALYCMYGEQTSAWAEIAIVPDAEGLLEHQQGVLGGCERSFSCELIGGAYISVQGQRSQVDESEGREDLLRSTYDSLRARLVASPPGASNWRPPTGTTPVTGACVDVLPAASLGEIYGGSQSVESVGWGGWSVRSWMLLEYWQTDACVTFEIGADPSDDSSFGSLTWLPGGEWAFDRAVSGEALAPLGAAETDQAIFSCEVVDGRTLCAVDVVADGNWVRVALPSGVGASDRVRVATEVAAAVIDTVRG